MKVIILGRRKPETIEMAFAEVEPEQFCEVTLGETTVWDALQEIPFFYENGIAPFVKDLSAEDSKKPLPSLIAFSADKAEIYIAPGNVILCGYDYEADELVSLNHNQIALIITGLSKQSVRLTDKDGKELTKTEVFRMSIKD